MFMHRACSHPLVTPCTWALQVTWVQRARVVVNWKGCITVQIRIHGDDGDDNHDDDDDG